MIAWFALGLGLVALGVVLAPEIRRIRGASENPAPQPEPSQVTLDDQQRLNLTTTWPIVSCQHCGTIHQGACPRIREVRFHASGNQERIIYWPAGKWAPPPGSITAWDVYGTSGLPDQAEATA
jgi:hypothetical protein